MDFFFSFFLENFMNHLGRTLTHSLHYFIITYHFLSIPLIPSTYSYTSLSLDPCCNCHTNTVLPDTIPT